ncbi:MAG: tetratricopeptide repeat protein [Enhygromyxa sp.]
MSWEPLVCSNCEVEAEFERVGRIDAPDTFAVAWLCGSCGGRLLDLVPIGVERPVPGACLNCGGVVDAGGVCGECGLSRPALVAAIREQCGDPPAIAAAEHLAARGLLRLALNALDLRLESCPDDPQSWTAKARMLDSVGFGARCVVPLERALALGGGDDLRLSLAVALAAGEQHERAVATFAEYLDAAPAGASRSLAWTRQARSLRALGRELEAEQALARALAEDPDDLQARVDLYTLRHAQRRFAEALTELDRALPRLEFGARVHLLRSRADLLCELERAEEGLATIDEVLEHTPDDPRALYIRGWALGLLGRLAEARTAIGRVRELEPDNPAAARALAQIDAALGDG